jgi:hypothetical protein
MLQLNREPEGTHSLEIITSNALSYYVGMSARNVRCIDVAELYSENWGSRLVLARVIANRMPTIHCMCH